NTVREFKGQAQVKPPHSKLQPSASENVNPFDAKVYGGGKKSLVIGVNLFEAVLGRTRQMHRICRAQKNGFG
ncbi:MAG: hypothetical protein WCS52_03765, partial [bacterium]